MLLTGRKDIPTVRRIYFYGRTVKWMIFVLFIFNSSVNVVDERASERDAMVRNGNGRMAQRTHMCASHELMWGSIAIGRHFDYTFYFGHSSHLADDRSAPSPSSRTKYQWPNWSRRPVIWFETSTNKNNYLYLWCPKSKRKKKKNGKNHTARPVRMESHYAWHTRS